MPPLTSDTLIEYQVTTAIEGDYIHVHVTLPDVEGGPTYSWYKYAESETFTKRAARKYFEETCGMNQETRDYVIDQIDFNVAKGWKPAEPDGQAPAAQDDPPQGDHGQNEPGQKPDPSPS